MQQKRVVQLQTTTSDQAVECLRFYTVYLKKKLEKQVHKHHLPSLYVPAQGGRDLLVSPGSGHSGKNHKHQQLPEVHHRVYELRKETLFSDAHEL